MTIQLPSLLSFERKLETSDALMYSGNWGDLLHEEDKWQAIPITERYNRSTQSSFGINDAKKSEPNPVSAGSDDANLPHDRDTLKISFTLRVIGNVGVPFACNEPDFEEEISKKVGLFKQGNELKELALRYAYNIANGRFLWRNRVGAEKVTIHVFNGEETEPLEFNAYDYSLKDFEKNNDNENLQKLTEIFQKGLNAEDDFVFIKVNAYVKLGDGQHIFPSEEMNMNGSGKTLFKMNGCAAMHNVKIGNAIRTIDDWYDSAEFPIAAEPYGSVTQRGQAYRKSKDDLYTLMEHWVKDKELTGNDKNYVTANLIRGGVFGFGKKAK
jgi:CRISPR-associated protein Csy3